VGKNAHTSFSSRYTTTRVAKSNGRSSSPALGLLSHEHSVVVMDRVSSSPWLCKIGGEFYTGKYLFTVDYTENSIADDPAQHKQSHVLYLTDAGEYTGNFVALPNNRVRATNPALWRVGEGAPDFMPSQWTHSAEQHESYMDPNITFNNLYAPED
jgi:hypothetical protein